MGEQWEFQKQQLQIVSRISGVREMSFLKLSLNQDKSVSEPPSHLEAGNSISVINETPANISRTSIVRRGAYVVTGHWSPLVIAETPGPRSHGPQEPRRSAASWPTNGRETWSQTHQAVLLEVLPTLGSARGEGTGPQGPLLQRTCFSKNSSFQNKTEARKD